jgi:hypothetical protein
MRNSFDGIADGLAVLMVLLCVASVPAIWVGGSFFEARAYERVTGVTVTTWDAMWLSLRVDGCPQWREE